MEGLKPPEALSPTGNTSENWRRWLPKFTLYLEAIGAEAKPDPQKSAILLHCIDEVALEVTILLCTQT